MCGLKRSCSLSFNGDKGSSINYFHLIQEWTLLVFLFSNEVELLFERVSLTCETFWQSQALPKHISQLNQNGRNDAT